MDLIVLFGMFCGFIYILIGSVYFGWNAAAGHPNNKDVLFWPIGVCVNLGWGLYMKYGPSYKEKV